MRGTGRLPETIKTKRSDPIYMAHGYLTKVPVPAILPFVEAFTAVGDTVADPFAGSGMTGVAATMLGRKARLFDISVLGQHIGSNYVNLVDPHAFRTAADLAIRSAKTRSGNAYEVKCSLCGAQADLAKTVWSAVVECATCAQDVNYYQSLESAGWSKQSMTCRRCGGPVSSRSIRLGEEPVIDWVRCSCRRQQIEQPWTKPKSILPRDIDWPDLEIESTRQMYVASALGRNGLTSTARFFSSRNLSVLGALKSTIDSLHDDALRKKLLFAFTAILTRASKRYQWSRKRPLNAANSNYYVAPVFYEWNVLDLFSRKVDAMVRSDQWILSQRMKGPLFGAEVPMDVTYELASAERLPLADGTVDYVFTDPPFGSNIFYSDMNLFHEAWLGSTTDPTSEAVVDRVRLGEGRSAERYERILTGALQECERVLKNGGYVSMIFGNSSGSMWQLVQRAIDKAGLRVVPDLTAVLDKGQRSVKGLASGFENVATLDLVLTMERGDRRNHNVTPDDSAVSEVLDEILNSPGVTPSFLYLELLRRGFKEGWRLESLDLTTIADHLRKRERDVEARTALIK